MPHGYFKGQYYRLFTKPLAGSKSRRWSCVPSVPWEKTLVYQQGHTTETGQIWLCLNLEFLKNIYLVCVYCVCAQYTLWYMCGGQRTTCRRHLYHVGSRDSTQVTRLGALPRDILLAQMWPFPFNYKWQRSLVLSVERRMLDTGCSWAVFQFHW